MIFGSGRTKRLEKRVKELEDFLGLIYTTDSEGWTDYQLTANSYNGKSNGIIGKLIATQDKEEMAQRKGK